MKRLFYGLCLLNIGFLLWQFHSGRFDTLPLSEQPVSESILLIDEYERAKRGTVISDTVDRQIKLWRQAEVSRMLSDLKGERWQLKAIPAKATNEEKKPSKPIEPPVVRKTVEAAKPKVQPLVKACIEAGPFDDALEVKNWLVGRPVINKQISQKEVAIPSDYQVYFPAAKSQQQTVAIKSMLMAKGINDLWLIPSGELKGSYSLGVFQDKQRAIVLKGQLADKGVHAEIKQREKSKTLWFVKLVVEKTKLKAFEPSRYKLSQCKLD